MKRLFLKLPFMHQLLLGFLVVALVPLVISTALMLNIVNASLKSQAEIAARQQLIKVADKLQSNLQRSEEVSNLICENAIVSGALVSSSNALDSLVYNQIYRPGGKLFVEADVAVYDAGGMLRFSTSSALAHPSLPVRWGALYKAARSGEMVLYNVEDFEMNKSPYSMRTAQEIQHKGARVGYVVISFTPESLREVLSNTGSEQSKLIILDKTGGLMYTTLQEPQQKEFEMLSNHILSSKNDVLANGENEYFLQYDEVTETYIFVKQPVLAAGAAMKTLRVISVIMAAVSFALALLVSLLFSKGISRPIKKLSHAMGEVKKGNLNVQVSTKRKDELGDLTHSFNHMTQELSLYIDKTVQQQKQMNESQIRLLQAQLNPHFLYNTLDTVKWIAKMNQMPEIADIASNLAIILRQCVSPNQFVSLKKELEMVQSYINIQRIRFSGRFQYVVDLPKKLEKCIVPKLVLQPIVENAIMHGLAEKESGYIYIYAGRTEENLLQVFVTDDGCGMALEVMQRLSQSGNTAIEGHLGLYNVNNIIKMNYGSQYGISARAQKDVGTTVSITLPIQWEEDAENV